MLSVNHTAINREEIEKGEREVRIALYSEMAERDLEIDFIERELPSVEPEKETIPDTRFNRFALRHGIEPLPQEWYDGAAREFERDVENGKISLSDWSCHAE